MVWYKRLFTDVYVPFTVFVIVVLTLPVVLLYALFAGFFSRGERDSETNGVNER